MAHQQNFETLSLGWGLPAVSWGRWKVQTNGGPEIEDEEVLRGASSWRQRDETIPQQRGVFNPI